MKKPQKAQGAHKTVLLVRFVVSSPQNAEETDLDRPVCRFHDWKPGAVALGWRCDLHDRSSAVARRRNRRHMGRLSLGTVPVK